jgi:hypothetical protein
VARGPSSFKVNDVKRAVIAARKSGLVPTAIEVDANGKISVIVGRSSKAGDEGGHE